MRHPAACFASSSSGLIILWSLVQVQHGLPTNPEARAAVQRAAWWSALEWGHYSVAAGRTFVACRRVISSATARS